MLPIDLDLSPSLINRTAVFNIGRDINEILSSSREFAVRYRFFGRIESEWPNQKRATELLKLWNLAQAAASADQLRDWLPPGSESGPKGASATPRAFLLDPLYVLFAPLTRRDIVICHDLSTLAYPEWHEPTIGRLYREAFRRIIEIAPNLIAVSQNTADTIYANFGVYRNRLTVVPNYLSRFVAKAAASMTVRALRTANPYFLFVGSRETRKNVIGAINAFVASALADEGYRLYIVGGPGHGSTEIDQRAAEVPGVVIAGYLSDEELCRAYAGATGFLYPSYLEGFGVPLLEAMAFGIPSIATTSGASPEVGGALVRYRDPDDHFGMAQDLCAIARMTSTDRQRVGDGLRKRAHTVFSFEQYSVRLVAALRAAAGEEQG